MRSKQRLCSRWMFMEEFGNRPRDGDSVVGACSSPNLIEQDQTPFGKVVQNTRRFIHLYHKRGFSHRDVIARSHTGKNLIDTAHTNFRSRNKTSHLGQEDNKRCLSKNCRLTTHILTRNHNYLLIFPIKKYIVCDIRFDVM